MLQCQKDAAQYFYNPKSFSVKMALFTKRRTIDKMVDTFLNKPNIFMRKIFSANKL